MNFIFTKYWFCAVCLSVLMMSACKLDDTTISGIPLLDVFTIDELADKVSPAEQTFNINANEEQEIVGANGVKLMIPQNIFKTASGDNVNGTVQVKLTELLTKSAMVLANKPTAAVDGELLEAVGSFQITATQGDNILTIDEEFGAELDMVSTIADPTTLGVYYGDENTDGTVNWVLDANSQVPLNAGIHSFDVDELTWVSCAKPLESSTSHQLIINPGSLNNLHDQQGYLVFDNTNTVAALTPQGSQFVRNDVPEGQTATVVMIALDPTSIYLSIVDGVNLTSNKTIEANYNIVTEAELVTAIEALN